MCTTVLSPSVAGRCTLDVLELTDKKFVIRKSDSFAGVTTYYFSRHK